jgi:hypothetical protein
MANLPENLLNDTEEYLKLPLNRKTDLVLILNAYKFKNDIQGFENLCFTGKYLNGLFRVLKDSPNLAEVKSVDHIKKDIGENLEKVMTQLREIQIKLNDEEKTIINEKYLQLSQNSLQNLQALVEDLDNIKKYLNFLKRNKPA